jgi:hypothetical protein
MLNHLDEELGPPALRAARVLDDGPIVTGDSPSFRDRSQSDWSDFVGTDEPLVSCFELAPITDSFDIHKQADSWLRARLARRQAGLDDDTVLRI